MKMFSKAAALGTTAILCGLIGTTGALAQVETITVTSQKREQTLQEVPIAVSVVQGETLEDAQIIGWLFGLALKGKSSDEKFTYKATAEALYPISYESELDNLPEKANLVDTDVSLKLSYNLNSWTAFSYDFRAKREPLIAPDVQISHMALLNITIKNDPKEKTTPVLTK